MELGQTFEFKVPLQDCAATQLCDYAEKTSCTGWEGGAVTTPLAREERLRIWGSQHRPEQSPTIACKASQFGLICCFTQLHVIKSRLLTATLSEACTNLRHSAQSVHNIFTTPTKYSWRRYHGHHSPPPRGFPDLQEKWRCGETTMVLYIPCNSAGMHMPLW